MAWLLLLLLWALGQALALGHRLGHADPAPGHAHALHSVGGEHEDGDARCQLVDQAGLGEALLQAALPGPAVAACAAAPATPAPAGQGATGWRPYEARAPPRA